VDVRHITPVRNVSDIAASFASTLVRGTPGRLRSQSARRHRPPA
jgi:hypothetical protein